MPKLEDWDFQDLKANSTTPQINRQKSAAKVQVLSIDSEKQSGTFVDMRNGNTKASLQECDCSDFNYSGNSPRKIFAPCMHIYRLAIELGLFSSKHYDEKVSLANMTPEEKKDHELKRIQNIEHDDAQWGSWGLPVHNSQQQTDRQHRGYEVYEGRDFAIIDESCAEINGYHTTLYSCSCPDFEERKVPCKHIYCLAIFKKIPLHISHEKYQHEKERFKEMFVPVVEISAKREDNYAIRVKYFDEKEDDD